MFGNNSKQNLVRRANEVKIKLALEESMRKQGISPAKYREAVGIGDQAIRQSRIADKQQSESLSNGAKKKTLSKTISEYAPETVFVHHTRSR